MMTMQQDATLACIAKFQVTRWLHLYLFEGMPQKDHLRICVLTTNATSHQAVLEKMHRSSQLFEFNTMQVCPPGLHIMLGIFTKMFHLLEALCCQLDFELASCTTDFDSSNFSKYSQALQRLPLLQGDLKTAQHSQQVLQQVATYVALVHGEKNPLAVDLLKQSAAKKNL